MSMNERYAVKLIDTFRDDMGEMPEMQLFGYLKNRLLVDCTAEQVLEELTGKDEITVRFRSNLVSGKVTDVNIRKTRST